MPLLPDRVLNITPAAPAVDVVLEGIGPDGPQPNVVEVAVQVPLLDAAAPGGTVVDLDETGRAWQTTDARTGIALGAVSTLARPAGEARVVVRELERTLSGIPGVDPLPILAQRVVFADSIVL